jgi:ribonuclease HI
MVKNFYVEFDEIFDTDHGLLHALIDSSDLIANFNQSQNNRSSFKREVFAYDKMNNDDWNNYQSFITDKIKQDDINKHFINQNNRPQTWINELWEYIVKVFSDAKRSAGKTHVITRKDKRQMFNKIQNERHKALKFCIKWRCKIKNLRDLNEILTKEQENTLINICKEYKIPNDKYIDKKVLESDEIRNVRDIIVKINYIIKQIRMVIDAEDTIEKLDQIKIDIDKRCLNFKEDKYSMLNSLLNREKKSIIIDHLVTQDEQGFDKKIIDEVIIKQKVKENFENITNYQVPDRGDLEQNWESFYIPREDIDTSLYNHLLDPISIEEWSTTCAELNKEKAPGITEISYDLIKKAGSDMNNIIRELVNEVFKQRVLPKGWMKAQIFPIPKPEDWGGNINKTRPITLLECPRKIMFKVLNNRLSNILVNNNHILGENNFAALPGKSTIEPIHTINCILEDARENNRELWMLFQDMSKAYDRVNRKFLFKALRRIQIPNEFIDLLNNSLEGRTNHVITAVGNTDEYIMKNGIDQGEVISPLLWVIYYNPLFEKINSYKENAYKMEFDFKWIRNRHYMVEYMSSIAYMDDTAFLAPSRQAMEQTLQIADEFNSMIGILVNPNKSELIVINSDEEEKAINYGNNEYNIVAKKELEPVRYLGVWLSGRKNDKFIKSQCRDEITVTTNRLKRKKITSQQIIYVFNAVIIPRIEYRTNLTVLDEKSCDKLQAPIRRLLRHKSNLANTLPNAILWTKEIYGLLDIYNRCIEQQTANLIINLNDCGKLGKLMDIRVAQLQIKEWLPSNPLTNWIYYNPLHFKFSLIAQNLSVLNNWEINIKWNKPDLIDFEGNIPLSRVLENYNYRKYKDKLRSKKLMFLDQLTEDSFLLQWDQLFSKNKFNKQGKIPYWWILLEKKLIIDDHRFIQDKRFITNKDNPYCADYNQLLMYTKIDKRKNNWIINKRNHQDLSKNVIIGLLVNNSWSPYKDFIKIIHYRFQSRDDTNLTVVKCYRTNCEIGLSDGKGNCIVVCDRHDSLKLNFQLVRLKVDHFILKQPYYSLYYELNRNRRIESELEGVNIVVSERENRKIVLSWIFKSNVSIIEELILAFDKLSSYNNTVWDGYTDGSLTRYDDLKDIDMGMGWLILKDEKVLAEFCASSFEWPSSTRMELMAVISLISVLPLNSTINIFTDSKNIIDTYNRLSHYMSFRKKRKIINYNLWELFFWILKEFSITLKFHKVKAHSDNIYNNRADILAKIGADKLSLRINDMAINQKATLAWMEFSVEIDPRLFVKKVNYERIDIKIDNLNRMKGKTDEIDKEISFNVLEHKDEKKDLGFFNLKDDQTKSFRVKKLFNELPTLDNLKKRQPHIYKAEYLCARCRAKEETITHLWECSKATNDIITLRIRARRRLFKLIDQQSEKFNRKEALFDDLFPFFKTKKELAWHTPQNRDFYRRFEDKKFRQDFTYVWDGVDSFDDILRGWVPVRLVDLLYKYMKRKSKKVIKQILVKWMGKINNLFFELIWKKRNEEMIEWECSNNIDKQLKRKKKSLSKRRARSRSNSREENKITFSGKRKNSVHLLDERLYDRIKAVCGLLRENFYRVVDKKILIMLISFEEWCIKFIKVIN